MERPSGYRQTDAIASAPDSPAVKRKPLADATAVREALTIMQKVEGNVSFHTARSTAFPQPEPGKAKSPGPMAVPAGELGKYLGLTDVKFAKVNTPLAIMDSTLD